MTDHRPRVVALMNSNQWIFVAINLRLLHHLDLPIEKWKIGDKKYLLVRVTYTKKEIDYFTTTQMIPKIDLYYLYDNNDRQIPLASVWKPDISGFITIQYNHKSDIKLKDGVDLQAIKNKILELMGNQTIQKCVNLACDELKDYRLDIL